MRLIIRDDPLTVGDYVANYIAKRINDFAPTADKPFVLGLPTGSSPIPTYKALITKVKEGSLSFKHVVTFNMDEYVGSPVSHEQSYHHFMYAPLFKHVDIEPENVHILDGNAADLTNECEQFELKIKKAGGIHLFVGGIGTDGHIAFNEPGSSLASRTRVETLTLETIRSNARFFDNRLDLVPVQALTVGVGTVMDAQEVMLLITGHQKAQALQQTIEGGVSHLCTCSVFQMHPKTILVVDEEATDELKVKTVRHIKAVMEIDQELK